MKALERENRELKRTNEILRKASAFFAQAELDPPTEVMAAFIDDHRDASSQKRKSRFTLTTNPRLLISENRSGISGSVFRSSL